MDDLKARQARFNAESRDQWEGFADHRRKVSTLLGAGPEPAPTRLCVLGAGNGNDLDLPALLAAHREVHLVDLDAEALARGVERQGVAGDPRVHCHGGLDVTGMLDVIAGWSPRSPIPASDLTALVEWPGRIRLALPGPFDVVASTCLLSQIVGNVFPAIGEDHPQFLDAVRAIRLGHLRLLANLTRIGGRAVLISDVVSSERFPALASIPEPEYPGLLRRLTADRGIIHGMNPAELIALFRQDPALSSKVAGLEAVPPWLWKLHSRLYLVWALNCRM